MNSAEAMQRSGCTYRQLDYWTRQGLLHPVGGGGSGFNRSWPVAEVNVIRRMVQLVQIGLSPVIAEHISRIGAGGTMTLVPGVEIHVTDEGAEQ